MEKRIMQQLMSVLCGRLLLNISDRTDNNPVKNEIQYAIYDFSMLFIPVN